MADVFYKIKATVNGSTKSIDVPVVASKLAHTITINGTLFDGTEDVDLTIEGSGGTTGGGPYDSILDNNTYQQIRTASDARIASSIWSVGDPLSVHVEGTIWGTDINDDLYAFIGGFEHNPDYEGYGTIHFFGFRDSDGTNLCLIGTYYNSTNMAGALGYFNMNHWGNYNYGGWAAADIRYDVLGSTDVEPKGYGSARSSTNNVGYNATTSCATNPVPNTLMDCLPLGLRTVMKPMTKYSDNVGGAVNSADNVTPTIDYLPLLSRQETGSTNSSYRNEYQTTYQWYADGNDTCRWRRSGGTTGDAAFWWTRSAYTSSSYSFCLVVTTSGSSGNYYAYNSYGLSPAFAI